MSQSVKIFEILIIGKKNNVGTKSVYMYRYKLIHKQKVN